MRSPLPSSPRPVTRSELVTGPQSVVRTEEHLHSQLSLEFNLQFSGLARSASVGVTRNHHGLATLVVVMISFLPSSCPQPCPALSLHKHFNPHTLYRKYFKPRHTSSSLKSGEQQNCQLNIFSWIKFWWPHVVSRPDLFLHFSQDYLTPSDPPPAPPAPPATSAAHAVAQPGGFGQN